MAHARGLLQGPDLNPVQELCLETYIFRQEIKASKKEIQDFEQLLMIHRPEAYEKYMENKKEEKDLGFDHIVWKTPDSIEEAEELMKMISESNALMNKNNNEDNTTDEKDYSSEINFIEQFEGIDISKFGDEDG